MGAEPKTDAFATDQSGAPRNRAREGRSELMQRVTEFVMKHDVALTGSNLSTIVAALSGSDSGLARALTAREISQEPISQDWLDQQAKNHTREDERANAIEGLMDRIEKSLAKFAETAQSAQAKTSEHRGAISDQITKMAETTDESSPRAEIDRLVELSRAMLNRISQVESAMEESQAETAELRESLAEARAEADVDHLTRLPNRRAFERELESAADFAEESGEDLCVGFCDVDHFKSINDTHGHDAGDRVLVAIARTLQRHAGKNCFAARHGGEEFVMLFQGMSVDDAIDRMDRMRIDLSGRQMVNRDSGKSFGRITFSGGVSQVHGVHDAREALARADAALYEAKQGGRDQVRAG